MCQPGYGKVSLLWWSEGHCAAKQNDSVYCCIESENAKDTFVLLACIIDEHWKETVKEWKRGTKASIVAAVNRLALSHANKSHSNSLSIFILYRCYTFSNALFWMTSCAWKAWHEMLIHHVSAQPQCGFKDLIFGEKNKQIVHIYILASHQVGF